MSNNNTAVNIEKENDFIGAADRIAKNTIAILMGRDRVEPKASASTSDDRVEAEIAALINKPTSTEELVYTLLDWAGGLGLLPERLSASADNKAVMALADAIDVALVAHVDVNGPLVVSKNKLTYVLERLASPDNIARLVNFLSGNHTTTEEVGIEKVMYGFITWAGEIGLLPGGIAESIGDGAISSISRVVEATVKATLVNNGPIPMTSDDLIKLVNKLNDAEMINAIVAGIWANKPVSEDQDESVPSGNGVKVVTLPPTGKNKNKPK